MQRRLAYLFSFVLIALLALAGCGSDGVTAGTPGNTGRLQVALTDQTGDYASVVVSIREVWVATDADADEPREMRRVASFSPPRVVDVLTLDYETLLLGEEVLPAGTYRQVRLVLADNLAGEEPANYLTLTDDPNTPIELRTPSGQQSGLKLNGRFTIEPNQLTAILLDFDPSRAIVRAGNSGQYLLKPTGIRVIELEQIYTEYGGLSGAVLPSGAWTTAVVQAVPSGSTTALASTMVDPESGAFRLLLPAGNYTVRADASGYTGVNTALENPPRVFTVVDNQDTAIGALTLEP